MRGNNKCTFGLIRTIGFISLSLLASLFSVSTSAATTYYWFTGTSYATGQYASPAIACETLAKGTYAPMNKTNNRYDGYTLTYVSAVRYNCHPEIWDLINNKYNSIGTSAISRSGDSCPSGQVAQSDQTNGSCGCPSGKVLNSTTNQCETPPDKCAGTAGSSVFHEVDGGEIGKSAPTPDGVVCDNQCQYAFSYEAPTTAYRFVEQKEGKNLNHAYFKYRYQGNGISCSQNNSGSTGSVFDQPPTKPPSSTEPTKEAEEKCTAWTTGSDGTSSRSCTKSTVYKDPGKLNCSTGTGTVVCSPGNPSPALNDTKVTDTTTKTTNSDGSTSTSTSTVTGVTKCFGVKPCDTSNTTTTSTGGTNADGSDKGTSTTCTGDQCKDSDWDDATTDPDAEGEEEGEDDKSSVSGEACDVSIACEGDAIQCAILRQEKASQCADAEFRDIDEGKLKTAVEGEFSGSDFQPLTADGSGTFDMSTMINTSSQLPSTCPQLPHFSITLRGQTKEYGFDEGISELCKYAVWFSYLMVAFAMYRAAGIIAGGMN